MSSERLTINLARDDDAWSAYVASAEPTDAVLFEQRFAARGDGPADVLEQIGQQLDVREIARIKRERGI